MVNHQFLERPQASSNSSAVASIVYTELRSVADEPSTQTKRGGKLRPLLLTQPPQPATCGPSA